MSINIDKFNININFFLKKKNISIYTIFIQNYRNSTVILCLL